MIVAWYTRERNGGVARSFAFGRRSSRTSATLNNQPVTQLTYDQIGNRITCNNTHYRPNACNQYEDLSYDSDGNMTMYDGWALTWNGENRLIRMIKGSAKLEFAYDYMGRRYEKKVYNNNNLTKHQRFIYDGYKLIEIRDALNNDALTHSFVWRKVPQDVPYSMTYGNTTYYYITDANKNVVCLLSNYSIDAYYQYGPWGEIREIEGTAAYWNPFRFSSEYYDDESGLVYYNYRYYSPALGRWLSRDPIGEEGGMNLYAIKDSINHFDSLGLALYGVDGTWHSYTNIMFEESVVLRFLNESAEKPSKYWAGPQLAITGLDSWVISDRVVERICDDYRQNKNIKINLIGWSRGATIVIDVANRLKNDGCCCDGKKEFPKINWIGLLDTVDLILFGNWSNKIPNNVIAVDHLVKSEKNSIFITTDIETESKDTKLNIQQLPDSNHGEIGGAWGDSGYSKTTQSLCWLKVQAQKAGVKVIFYPEDYKFINKYNIK